MQNATVTKGKRAIIVFDTLFGNTERIAQALSDGIRERGVYVDCVNIHSVSFEKLSHYDLIAVGAPTHHLTASQPMKDFLEKMGTMTFMGQYGFAFDTRISYFFAGSAARYIEERLEDLGLVIVKLRSSALVKDAMRKDAEAGEALLEAGQEEQFRKIGNEIGLAMLV